MHVQRLPGRAVPLAHRRLVAPVRIELDQAPGDALTAPARVDAVVTDAVLEWAWRALLAGLATAGRVVLILHTMRRN